MRSMNDNAHASTFIVRLIHNPTGEVSGVVERVRTGVKHKFEGRDALCELIRILVAKEDGGRT